jgi:hypothetical protein
MQVIKFHFIPLNENTNQKLAFAAEAIVVPNLNHELNICHTEGNYQLVLSDQYIPLHDGSILKDDNLIIKLSLLPILDKNVTTELISTEENDKDNYFDSHNFIQTVPADNELDFLFYNSSFINTSQLNNQSNNFTNMILSGSGPLSLLNQHFQPPAIKIAETPSITNEIEEAIAKTAVNTDGNILRDLGLYNEQNFSHPNETHTNLLPTAYKTAFGYINEVEEKRNIINLSINKTKKSGWHNIKKILIAFFSKPHPSLLSSTEAEIKSPNTIFQ